MLIPMTIVGGTAVAAVAFMLMLRRQGHPDDGRDRMAHPDEHLGPTGASYPPGSRPGGPGAEGMNVSEAGRIAPGAAPHDEAESRPED